MQSLPIIEHFRATGADQNQFANFLLTVGLLTHKALIVSGEHYYSASLPSAHSIRGSNTAPGILWVNGTPHTPPTIQMRWRMELRCSLILQSTFRSVDVAVALTCITPCSRYHRLDHRLNHRLYRKCMGL
jgi:hypothetical protein